MKFKKLVSTVVATGLILASVLDPFGLAGAASVQAAGASDFNNISLARGYKDIGNHNPCITQKFSADPCAMEYNGRIYVYSTNDGNASGSKPAKNTYGQINTINVMSSDDMVNWTDHGTIAAAGSSGAARWAANSWAPTACHKKINGKEKFFLYFANSAGGIGVLTSDSPTGPWKDPIGKALISRQTPNCNVEWLFDPAVLVDTDGTGYLYFGGGVPTGKSANPNTIRVVKLGNDMTSIVGTAVNIDAPWVFEDSGINKVGNTYYYSYCTNWNGGPMGNAKIAYMTSSKPMGPFTYQGTCLNNPGDFFGTVGNNHHSMFTFKNQSYIIYHAEWLNKQIWGEQVGYRTAHVDTISFNNGKISNAKGTLKGVSQVQYVNPLNTNRAANMAWQGGINVYGLGDTTVAYNRGDWTGVAGVNFSSAANKVTLRAASANGGTIRITTGSANGTVVGYVTIPRTGSNSTFQTVTANVNSVSGVKDLFFTASSDIVLDTWTFGSGNDGGSTTPTPSEDPTPSVDTGATAKISDGWYYIKNTGSQKYLQVAGNTGKANANVEISTGTGAAGQKWKVTNTSDGYITLTSALGDFMLDVASAKNEDGTNIGIYNAHGGDAQKFQAKATSQNNVVTIVTKASSGTKALDVYNFGTADGTNVCQWSFGGKENQTWVFEPIQNQSQPSNPQPTNPQPTQPTETGKIADGWYYIKGVASQKYLQVAGNTGKNVTNVNIGTKTGVDGQLWKVTSTSNGYFTLTSKLGDFGLDIGNGSAENGANAQIYALHGGDAQQFTVKASSQSGAYAIATKCSNGEKVLDVEGKKTADGTNVCQYTNNGQTNQMWIFEAANVSNESQSSQTQPSQPEQTQPAQPEQNQPATNGKLGVSYTINSWGSGYQVSFKVENKSGARVNSWTVTVPKSELNITASWNVTIKESGSNYVITPVSWNSAIENGNSVEFGIQGSGSIGNTLSATVK